MPPREVPLRRFATPKRRFDSPKRNQNASNSNRKGPRIDYQGTSNGRVATRRKKRATVKIDTKFSIEPGKVVLDLPLQTVSEANSFERWQLKHARHKDQKRVVALGLVPLREHIRLPCKIFLTRFAPDELDVFDNLPMSFKYIVDAICAIITGETRAGKADSDKRISISCDQVESKAYGIRIEVTY